MLYHIPSIITPELLYALRAMGHGDELVITDANFPAASHGQQCLYISGVTSSEILSAILTLLPIDSFVEQPFATMAVVDRPESIPQAVLDFIKVIQHRSHPNTSIQSLERFEFYERAKRAFIIIQTSDIRPYANIILKKGNINSLENNTVAGELKNAN